MTDTTVSTVQGPGPPRAGFPQDDSASIPHIPTGIRGPAPDGDPGARPVHRVHRCTTVDEDPALSSAEATIRTASLGAATDRSQRNHKDRPRGLRYHLQRPAGGWRLPHRKDRRDRDRDRGDPPKLVIGKRSRTAARVERRLKQRIDTTQPLDPTPAPPRRRKTHGIQGDAVGDRTRPLHGRSVPRP